MPLATIAEADSEYARNVGRDRPDQAWILSDRDVWYRNPFYTGPAVPHPEDDGMDDDFDPDLCAHFASLHDAHVWAKLCTGFACDDSDIEIPF